MTVAFEDGQAAKHVPYAHVAVSRNVRGLVTALLFMVAAVFLRWGDKSSLAEHQNVGLSNEQNLGVTVFFAFVFLIFGFHSLFWTWKKEADRPASVVVSDDSIIPPNQRAFGQKVEIRFAGIALLKSCLLIVWERHVA